jgi:hypothetical protein
VEQQALGGFRVLNVPVWVYGISVGTLVDGKLGDDGVLEFRDLIEPSPGGTVRYIVPEGRLASEVYLTDLGPEATRRGIGVGPATFLDPLIVALHIHNRAQWSPALAEQLNQYVDRGVIEQWEVGDPDEYSEEDDSEAEESAGSELVHPSPTSARQEFFRL